jgi:hypothetical protein
MTALPPVQFQPRWKEELVCTLAGQSFVVELTMGVLTVYFPTQAKWEVAAPAWAKPQWARVHQDLTQWCAQQKIPLRITDDAWVSFG